MSSLRELMEELCPDGVEYVPLWSVTIWDKKFNAVERDKQPIVENYRYLLANDLFLMEVDKGDVFLLSTGERTGWTTEELAGEYLKEGEVVSIPWGKSRDVTDCIKYYKGKFVTADNRIATSNDITKLSNRYLYYWMMSQGKVIDTFYRGSGIKHPDMAKVLNMQIPIPPLAIQNEIVKLLDDFTELTAELTEQLMTELTLRKKQYNFYRDSLLNFVRVDDTIVQTDRQTDRQAQRISKFGLLRKTFDVEWKTLGEVSSQICSGGTPTASNAAFYVGTIPWLRTQEIDWADIYDTGIKISEEALKASSARWIPANCVIVAMYGATAAKVAINRIPLTTNQACCNLKINEEMAEHRYVYHWLCSQYKTLKAKGQGSQSNINKSIIEKYPIPIPPLEVQQKIVSILDRFDALCNDLTNGLPAEIAARKKQYEHYRDRLLTFPRSKLEERS